MNIQMEQCHIFNIFVNPYGDSIVVWLEHSTCDSVVMGSNLVAVVYRWHTWCGVTIQV